MLEFFSICLRVSWLVGSSTIGMNSASNLLLGWRASVSVSKAARNRSRFTVVFSHLALAVVLILSLIIILLALLMLMNVVFSG